MTPDTIFAQAIAIDSAEQRAQFLDNSCRDDPDMRREVERLVSDYFRAGDFLEQPAGYIAATLGESACEGPGTVIGPYKLMELIGEGGFGLVYVAEQQRPVRRRVALKVIKPGMDSRQVVARFEAERQALALMDHPNIARVLDADAMASGRPYFVMELVKGVPITNFCDTHRLSTQDRLGLFVSVCSAVQHAHQKGVIHRDLKPSNVLVTSHDGTPTVKVIDFGVAKAIGQQLTEKTVYTQFTQMVGTPLYMSPEQAGQSGLDVDTRTDIYALGVLLYELLTGTTPFDEERLRAVGFDEMRRIIRDEEPAKPSTRISTLGQAAVTVSVNRQTDPKRLSRLCRGELDWIVMKALEKDRNRRYESASAFAADVERYLRDEPVQACPPSAGYRLQKFVRRHLRVLTAALAFVLLLVTGVVALSVALVAVNRERREKEAALESEAKRRKQARAALDALSSDVIEDWLARQPQLQPEHRRFLEHALQSYEEFAADTGQHEESRAAVASASRRVASIRTRLSQWKEAEVAWERSRDLYAGLVAEFPQVPSYRLALAASVVDLGKLYREAGPPQQAERALTQGLAIYRSLVTEFPDAPEYRKGLASSLNVLGTLFKNENRKRESEKAYREALGIHKQLVAEFPTSRDYRYGLGQAYMGQGLLLQGITGRSREAAAIVPDRSSEAIESLAEAVAIYKQLAAEIPSDSHYRDQLATALNNLGNSLRDARRDAEAEDTFGQARTIRTQLVAEFPAIPHYRRGLAIVLNNLGIVFKSTDRPEMADELYRQTVTIHKQLAADFPEVPNHQNEAGAAMVNLARLHLIRNDAQGARQLLEEALPYTEAALKVNPRDLSYRNNYRLNRWRMAEALLELKEHAAAAVAAEQFLQTEFEPPRDAYTAAGLLAGCAGLAAKDDTLADDKRQELATSYGDRAVAALRQAIHKGAKEVTRMAEDPSLAPLRSRPDFQKLLAEWGRQKK